MPIRVAINGLGRIGRLVLRSLWDDGEVLILAANSPSSAAQYAHLIKYDSAYGRWDKNITARADEAIMIDGRELKLLHQNDPALLPWRELDIDVVIESTGVFRNRMESEKHLAAGAKRIIISAPAKEADITLLPSINLADYRPEAHKIVSLASCTTNCAAPIVKVLHRELEIVHGYLTTIHAYTNDQRLVDSPHPSEDFRRARAAGESIIPTSTGAAKTLGEIMPELKGKLSGIAMRTPIILPSIISLALEVKKPTEAQAVNAILKQASLTEFKGIMDYSEEPLVSVDYKQNPHASIIDALSTEVVDNTLVNIVSWYDNEWGYVQQLVKLLKFIGK